MYCSNCGNQIKSELNYCNHCGMKVSKVDAEMQKSVSDNLSASLGYIGGFGLFGFIFVALVLVKNSVHPTALTFISLFYLLSLFGVCFLILQQIRRFSEKSSAKAIDFSTDFQTGRLGAANMAQLEEYREPAMSVTENTTRTLDKVESKI